MKKQYYITNLGHRLILDWRKKRFKRLEKLLEEKENNEWAGKKLDYFAGVILAWVLVLVFSNHFMSIQLSLYLSVLGPIAFSWIYNREKVKRLQIIGRMKKEREQKSICLQNLQTLQLSELDDLTLELAKMLGLSEMSLLGQGLPITGSKDEKKVAIYLDCRKTEEQVTLNQIYDFIELTKNQGATGGVYFAVGAIDEQAKKYAKNITGYKIKLVEQEKLIQIFKNMQHSIYQENEKIQTTQEAKKLELMHSDKKKLLQIFTDKPTLVRKYLLVSLTLVLLSLIMTGWLKLFYLILGTINFALAFYTYISHLPSLEEEKIIIDELL